MRTVLITGGSTGVGLALVKAYLKHGHRVINVDRVSPKDAIVGEYHYVQADLSETDRFESIFERCKGHTHRIDCFVHAAHIEHEGFAESIDVHAFEHGWRANVLAPMLFAHAFIKQYDGAAGRIVFLTDSVLAQGRASEVQKATEKGALHGAVAPLTDAGKSQFITVNTIELGWLRQEDETVREVDHGTHPSRRVGTLDDCVRACLFLTDEHNQYINGETIVLDGGWRRIRFRPE